MAPPKAKGKSGKKLPTSTKPRKEPKTRDAEEPGVTLPLELQQLVLNVFKNTFSERLEQDIKPLLQEVKGHLYRRDFQAAFGKPEYLEAYAARWSPSRALGYLQIFSDLKKKLQPFSHTSQESEESEWKVVCLGGGAGAEIAALGAYFNVLEEDEHGQNMHVTAIDIADWGSVANMLRESIVNKPPLSKYASAAAQAANVALTDPACFAVDFHQHDVLNTPFSTLASLVGNAHIITLMFTLNELYATSLSMTQKLLLSLTTSLKPGACLLVVDSPGSYSTVTLNGAEKKYPMQWLLDHTLLSSGKTKDENIEAQWEKIEEAESRWFRLDESLKYPVELENMRYQIHLYRKLG